MADFDDFPDMWSSSSSDAPFRRRRAELATFDEVLDAAGAGDSWAFERLFSDIQSPLRAFAVARGAGDPDGLVNEVLSEVFEALPAFRGDQSAYRGFVFHVARRRLIDEYRRRARRPRLDLRAEPIEPPTASADPRTSPDAMVGIDLERALRMLDGLTPDQRDVLALRVICDLSLAETAAAVGKPLTAVKALQRRGIATLRRSFSAGTVSS